MRIAGNWLGNCFSDYLSNSPREVLLMQLHMFSEGFIVEEAFERIVECAHLIFTEDFSTGIEDLSSKLRIKLEPIHIRKSRIEFNPTSDELARLYSILEPELLLYDKLKQTKQQ